MLSFVQSFGICRAFLNMLNFHKNQIREVLFSISRLENWGSEAKGLCTAVMWPSWDLNLLSRTLSPKHQVHCPQPQGQACVPTQPKQVTPLCTCLSRPKFSYPCVSHITAESSIKKKNSPGQKGGRFYMLLSPSMVTVHVPTVQVAAPHKTGVSCSKAPPKLC